MQRRKLIETTLLSTMAFIPLTAYTQRIEDSVSSLADPLPPNMANLVRLEVGQKVEVRKFLGYWCPHCASLEPHFNQWAQTLRPTVKIRRTPVAFQAGQEGLAILLLVIESFENKNHSSLHLEVFSAIHKTRSLRSNATIPQLQAFAAGILKEPEGEVRNRWNSFAIRTRLANEKKLVTDYKIQSIPTIIVQGRFMTSPSRVGRVVQGERAAPTFFRTLDNLIEKFHP